MFETTICTGENTCDPSPGPQGMNLLQPETTCCSQISIYNHYLLSLKNPQIKSRAAEICNVAAGKNQMTEVAMWREGYWECCCKSSGCPRVEMHPGGFNSQRNRTSSTQRRGKCFGLDHISLSSDSPFFPPAEKTIWFLLLAWRGAGWRWEMSEQSRNRPWWEIFWK